MHGKGSHPALRSDTTSIKRKHVSQPSTVLVRLREAQQASPHALALLCVRPERHSGTRRLPSARRTCGTGARPS
eukprot:scaffold6963_cov69-Phaeocystis_antarctica.AAC.1